MVFAIQQPFKDKLENLQKQHIILSLGVDQTSEKYKNLVLIAEPIEKRRLCLNQVSLHQVFITPVYSSLTH